MHLASGTVRDQPRSPGGAFPSSFEQAEKGGFLDLMPWILKGMSCGNQIIKYFDVTPGSQITWTTWAAIVQKRNQEGGRKAVEAMLARLETSSCRLGHLNHRRPGT